MKEPKHCFWLNTPDRRDPSADPLLNVKTGHISGENESMYSFCQTSVEWGKVGELGIDRHDATPARARPLPQPAGGHGHRHVLQRVP